VRRIPTGDLQELLQELQLHQAELEVQNQDLQGAQLELAEAHERLADLYDHAPVGFVTCDQHDVVLFANLALADCLGVARADLIGRRFAAGGVAPLREDQDTYHLHRQQLRAPEARARCELRLRGASGAERWARLESRVEVRGGALQVRTAVIDLSGEKEAEAERARLERELHEVRLEQRVLQAERLESLGTLAAGIAHDFNNLLAAICGNLELASLHLPPSSPARAFNASALAASHRAAELVDQLLAHAGRGTPNLEPVAIGQLVNEMLGLLGTSLPKKVRMTTRVPADLPRVRANPTQLRQVLLNLVVNAAEAMGEVSGEVEIGAARVACSRARLDELCANQALPEGDYVRLWVEDSGCGMDAATLQRVYEPFFSTKRTGRGLGLAAVHGIVRAHEGALAIESRPGEGSRFDVYLPLAATPALDHAEEPLQQSEWRGQGTLLVADDEQVVRDVLDALLRQLGFSVVLTEDGARAVAAFQEPEADFAAVVLDHDMPELNGAEAFRQIHRLDPEVPILMLSGYVPEELATELAAEGLAGFLSKPFTTAELRATLRAALEE